MNCRGLLSSVGGQKCRDPLWSRVGTRGRGRTLEGSRVKCTIEHKNGLYYSVRDRKGVCAPLKANASGEETYVSPSSRTGSNELEALERYSEVCGILIGNLVGLLKRMNGEMETEMVVAGDSGLATERVSA